MQLQSEESGESYNVLGTNADEEVAWSSLAINSTGLVEFEGTIHQYSP